jgi:hypothetical protein
VRRQIQLIVCALIAGLAIGSALPGDALAGGRKPAAKARVAHSSSHPRKACLHCQIDQLRIARQAAAAEKVATAPDKDAVAEVVEAPAAETPPRRARPARGKRRKPPLLLRAKIATLHFFEALHLYHPQPNQGGERPRLTEERVWEEITGSLLGIDIGVTLSEITRVRGTAGSLELIHVVDQTGTGQNFESVVRRIPLVAGQRLEVQGPAINTTAGLPIGFRAIGLGLTSDLFEPGQNRAVSYTAEVKLTERAALYWAPLWAPGAASALDGALGTAGHHTVANLVGGALPVVSAALAVQSAVRAWRTFKNPNASRLQKTLAAGHVVADGIRVAFPLVGTLANVALIGVTAGVSYLKVKKARAEAEQPVDPRFLKLCARGGCIY